MQDKQGKSRLLAESPGISCTYSVVGVGILGFPSIRKMVAQRPSGRGQNLAYRT